MDTILQGNKVQAEALVEVVPCPVTETFMPLEQCRACEKHSAVEKVGQSPTTGMDLNRVLCLLPSVTQILEYRDGYVVSEVVNCGPHKMLRPLDDCKGCRLHGGIQEQQAENGNVKMALCCRKRGRPCSFLAIGLREVE